MKDHKKVNRKKVNQEMIDLTRLNGHRLVVNCELIKFVEATPDTRLTLMDGEKLIVRESCDELLALVAKWRKQTRCMFPADPAAELQLP